MSNQTQLYKVTTPQESALVTFVFVNMHSNASIKAVTVRTGTWSTFYWENYKAESKKHFTSPGMCLVR